MRVICTYERVLVAGVVHQLSHHLSVQRFTARRCKHKWFNKLWNTCCLCLRRQHIYLIVPMQRRGSARSGLQHSRE
jgi:hypothetical protein